jgi:hypothetical protein
MKLRRLYRQGVRRWLTLFQCPIADEVDEVDWSVGIWRLAYPNPELPPRHPGGSRDLGETHRDFLS